MIKRYEYQFIDITVILYVSFILNLKGELKDNIFEALNLLHISN